MLCVWAHVYVWGVMLVPVNRAALMYSITGSADSLLLP